MRTTNDNLRRSSRRTRINSRAPYTRAVRPTLTTRTTSANTSTGTIPPLVIDLVCDTIRERMNLEESFMGFPAPLEEFTGYGEFEGPKLELRQLLQTMSVVHPKWKEPALSALRYRVDIYSPEILEAFSQSSSCAPWVRELHFLIDMHAIRDIMYGLSETSLDRLHAVFARTPCLRALFLRVENWSKEVIEVPLTTILSTIPSGLQTLHIRHSTWTEYTLSQLGDVVSSLHNLTTLSVIGDTFVNKGIAHESLAPHVLRKAAPPTLKRVLLEYRDMSETAALCLSWLFTPRDKYSLHELKLRQNASIWAGPEEDPLFPVLQVLTPMLRELKVLEVGWYREDQRSPSFQCLMERCTTLEELYTNVFKVPAPVLYLPQSLQHLQVFRRLTANTSAASDDEELEQVLTPLLKQRSFKTLDVSELGLIKGRRREWHLRRTEELCKEHNVELVIANGGRGCTWKRFP